MTPRVRPAVAIGALVGWLVSLAPGALPRSMVVAAGAATALTLAGMAVGAVVGLVSDRIRGRRGAPRTSGVWLAAGLLLAGAAFGPAVRHEAAVRESLDAAPIGPWWALVTALTPLCVALVVVSVPRRIIAATGLVGLLAICGVLAGGPAEAHAPDVPDSPIVDYGSLQTAGDFDRRAEMLVDTWADRGGLDQRAAVVAVPTGSGWLDSGIVDGFAQRFNGSVRVLALQYDSSPSWQTYVTSPDKAGDSATALLAALDRRIQAHSSQAHGSAHPKIYLVGQSLGAVGADAARRWAASHRVNVDGTVLSGVPANTVPDAPACARRVILANADDPVADFSASLLWRKPHRVGVEANDRPWTPIISFVGTAFDLAGSLDAPDGHGHRYGVEQGLVSIPECSSRVTR